MSRLAILVAPLVITFPLLITNAAAASHPSRIDRDAQATTLDLSGRWQLNADLSDKPPQAGDPGERGGEHEGGDRGGGRPPRGGGYPGGMGGGEGGRGGGMHGGGGPGGRANPEEMAKMRDAMRAALEAPPEIVVTRKDDEVVFTATGSGDVTRILVTGQKMKTTAGGAEHDVKADYKADALVVESAFGVVKVVDTWRVSADSQQLERVTRVEGGAAGGRERVVRRVYQRVE
jgi:hypothetical protein